MLLAFTLRYLVWNPDTKIVNHDLTELPDKAMKT